jgi:hypothetical protein
MIISDKRSRENIPLVIHNIGRGTQEENLLSVFKLTGHYRMKEIERFVSADSRGRAVVADCQRHKVYDKKNLVRK